MLKNIKSVSIPLETSLVNQYLSLKPNFFDLLSIPVVNPFNLCFSVKNSAIKKRKEP